MSALLSTDSLEQSLAGSRKLVQSRQECGFSPIELPESDRIAVDLAPSEQGMLADREDPRTLMK